MNESQFRTDLPMLLIGFNRPALTRASLSAIRQCQPKRLFVAIDGPRPDKQGEAERVAAVVKELETVDWDCSLEILRQPVNLGCKVGVFTAISWFFESVDVGLIIEDDILVSPDLVRYTEAMLERYADEPNVWLVSGYNGLSKWRSKSMDHFFGEPSIWGWATWAHRWKEHDPTMARWADPIARDNVARIYADAWPALGRNFALAAAGHIDTWDYQWAFTITSHGGACVLPSNNLSLNFGFGDPDATHTGRASAMVPRRQGRWASVASGKRVVEIDRDFQRAMHRRSQWDPLLHRVIPAVELWDRIRPSSYR